MTNIEAECELKKYARQISDISKIMLHRLAQYESVGLPEFLSIVEDTGNCFLTVASEIRDTLAVDDQVQRCPLHSFTIIAGGRR